MELLNFLNQVPIPVLLIDCTADSEAQASADYHCRE